MSAQTLLLYVRATGHVLAAASVASPPLQKPEPQALVGAALRVRYVNAVPAKPCFEVSVPAAELAVLPIDSLQIAIKDAPNINVNPDRSVGMLAKAPADTKPTLTDKSLTLTFTTGSTDKLIVWAKIQPQTAVDPLELESNARTGSSEAVIVSGTATAELRFPPISKTTTYSILVLVSGFLPQQFTVTVP